MAPRTFGEIGDTFLELAPYYDRIMEHVNYDRWFMIATELASLLPPGFRHLEAACGTGTLLKRLRRVGWNSCGMDLSQSMLKTGLKSDAPFPAVAADLRALPFSQRFHYVTCLFDSINFLLEAQDLCRALEQVHLSLKDGGLFYFDAVTEKMVTQHFEGQEWVENNGRFTTTWSSQYSRKTGIVETKIRINRGAFGLIRERIYTENDIADAIDNAGFTLLGMFDAHTWKPIRPKTVRVDYVLARKPSSEMVRRFQSFPLHIREMIV